MTQNGVITISAKEMEWIDEEKIRRNELLALIVPPRNRRWNRMPVFKTDTLQTLIDRWLKMYPTEAMGLLAEAKLQFDDQLNQNGMSEEKLIQKLMSVPDMIYWGMYHIDNQYWNKNNLSGYRKFKELLPVFCSKTYVGKKSANYSAHNIIHKQDKKGVSSDQDKR